jgi:hypothetical protein
MGLITLLTHAGRRSAYIAVQSPLYKNLNLNKHTDLSDPFYLTCI